MLILFGGEVWCIVFVVWWLWEKKGKCESIREGCGWVIRCVVRGGGWI